jgi:hypothetical protein
MSGLSGPRARRAWLHCEEAWRLLQSLFLLLEVEARLRMGGFARLQEALRLPGGAAGTTVPPDAPLCEARGMAAAIRRAARRVPRARCLHRALALLLWLRRRGVAADLRIGVRSTGAALEGHAWVEWHDLVVDEDPSISDRFEPLEKVGGDPDPTGGSMPAGNPADREIHADH